MNGAEIAHSISAKLRRATPMLLEQFKLVKESPDGVGKLRELILDLAVRGKLVEQDGTGEPASKLLAAIRAERERQIAAKKIRRGKALPAIDSQEHSFSIPSSWEWCQFGELGDWGAGATPKRGEHRYYNGDIIWLKSGELNNGIVADSEEKVTQAAIDECSLRLNQPEDVLVAMYGATIGKLAIAGTECTTNQAVCACTCFDGVYNRFLFLTLRAFKDHFVKQSSGAAQPNYSKEKIVRTAVPLPPLAEQRRIVAKMDTLMGMCDSLETSLEHERSLRAASSRSCLLSLTSPSTSGGANGTNGAAAKGSRKAGGAQSQLRHAWQRLCDHFEVLFDVPETLADLRQTILQLAVQGKLVPQDPSDEPAETVLESVTKEQAELIAEGKIKKYKKLPPLGELPKPHDLPAGWCWTRFPELGIFGRGKSRHRPRNDPKLYENGKYPLVQTGDIARANGEIMTYTGMYNDAGLEQSKLWPSGTMCITIAANIADTGILGFEACIPDSVVGFIPLGNFENAHYFEFYMRTMQSNLESYAPSTAQKNINLGILETVLIPLPPLAEQKRIVSKVLSLQLYCDKLERTHAKRQSTAHNFLTAATHHLLSNDLCRLSTT